jgi:hypothetical protein
MNSCGLGFEEGRAGFTLASCLNFGVHLIFAVFFHRANPSGSPSGTAEGAIDGGLFFSFLAEAISSDPTIVGKDPFLRSVLHSDVPIENVSAATRFCDTGGCVAPIPGQSCYRLPSCSGSTDRGVPENLDHEGFDLLLLA